MKHLTKFLIIAFFLFLFAFSAEAAIKGDLNNDSKIDVIDLGILLSNWGSTTKPPADINQDGKVDVIDLGTLLSNWGKTESPLPSGGGTVKVSIQQSWIKPYQTSIIEILAKGDLIQAELHTDSFDQIQAVRNINPKVIILPFWSQEREWSQNKVNSFRNMGFDGMYIDLWNDIPTDAAAAQRAADLRSWWPAGIHVVNYGVSFGQDGERGVKDLNGFMWEAFTAGTVTEIVYGEPWSTGITEWAAFSRQPDIGIINDRLLMGAASVENRYDSFDFWKKGRYATGISLMHDNLYVMYNYGIGGSPHWASPWWLDEYEVDIGTAPDKPSRLSNGVWFREFSQGAVLVNDTGSPETVTASMLPGGPYWRFRGNQQPQHNNGGQFSSILLDGWVYQPDELGWITGDAIVLVKEPQTAVADVIVDDEASDQWEQIRDNIGSMFSHSGLEYNNDCGADPPEVYDCPGPQFPDSWYAHPDNSAHYGNGSAQWCTTIGVSGHWQIYEWHPTPKQMTAGTGNFGFSGQTSRSVNLNQNGGQWNLLWDISNLGAGQHCVSLSGNNIVADAIKFIYKGQ